MPGPSISVSDLVVRRGDTMAVDDVSFEVDGGEVVVLLGPNGAGKTTTVETIEGYLTPDRGTVRVCGLDPVADHDRVVRRLGVMLQGGGVYPGLRAIEVLEVFSSYYETSEDPAALLSRVGLADRARRTWRQMSGGEQQRLSLALALVGRPDVVVLDEPTSGVDLDGRRVVRDLVRGLAADGVAVLLTTHELAEAEKVADRAVVIDHGRVLAAGTLGDLRSGADEIRFAADTGLDVVAMAEAVAAPVREVQPGEFAVAGAPTPERVAALTAWLAERGVMLADLRAGRQTLEDVVTGLTSRPGETDAAADRRPDRAADPEEEVG